MNSLYIPIFLAFLAAVFALRFVLLNAEEVKGWFGCGGKGEVYGKDMTGVGMEV